MSKELGVAYFVAGAMARDIRLTNVFGIATERATRDVDFAVAVESWVQFEDIKKLLTAGGLFEADPKILAESGILGVAQGGSVQGAGAGVTGFSYLGPLLPRISVSTEASVPRKVAPDLLTGSFDWQTRSPYWGR